MYSMYRGLSFAKMKNKLNRKFGGLLSPGSKLNTQYLTNLTIVCPVEMGEIFAYLA